MVVVEVEGSDGDMVDYGWDPVELEAKEIARKCYSRLGEGSMFTRGGAVRLGKKRRVVVSVRHSGPG